MDAEINKIIFNAKSGDISARDFLIESNKGFVRRVSSYICKRNLDWSNDDELSIALIAFNEAIDSFDPDRSPEFFVYTRMLIKSRLIDYFRKNNNNSITLNSIEDEDISAIESKEAVDRFLLSRDSEERTLEIRMLSSELAQYNLSFSKLVEYSPRHKDTRRMLFEIASICSRDQEILKYIKKNKMLPIKEIMQKTNTKRKLLESWRKYLIALLVISSSDEYLYIKEYINF